MAPQPYVLMSQARTGRGCENCLAAACSRYESYSEPWRFLNSPKVSVRHGSPPLSPLTPQAIRKVGHRYQQGGLERALYEKERPGAAEVLEDSEKQRIIAMVCSDPPEGRARWTVGLVVEEAIKRKLVPRVGRETIRMLLLHHDLKPWREKNVVRGRPR